jgi:putative flippase GtrA
VQLTRSLIVSAIALVVDFSALIILKQEFGINYLLAAAISFSLGVLVNYSLSVKWVFAYRQLSSKTHEFIIFVVITALGLLFNLLIIAGMVELLKADYRVGKLVSTVVVFFWNFLARKKILY